MNDQEVPRLATIAIDCQEGIANLVKAMNTNSYGMNDLFSVREAKKIQDRYNQWAGNLGALQDFKSPLSLVHRLRDAPVVRDSILSTLTDLLVSIHGATDIAAGRRPNRVAGPLIVDSDIELSEYGVSSSESDTSSIQSSGDERNAGVSTSELRELSSAINIGIDNLFKASMFVRKFAPKDKRLRAARTKPFDNRADVMYVNDRYPLLAQKNAALAARLGEANARRRQYFKYRRDHNERLSTVVVKDDAQPSDKTPKKHPEAIAGNSGNVGPAKSAVTGETQPSLFAETEATTFVLDEAARERMLEMDRAAPAKSVVSFATSIAEPSDEELPFPPVPEDAQTGSPFLCPYCLTFQRLKREDFEDQWRKHVLQDLEPYICTFSSCGLDTFRSQHAWFDHELQVHRSRWVCQECSISFKFPDNLGTHISRHHSENISDQQLPTIIDLWKRPITSIEPNECPLCDDPWAEADLNSTSSEGVLVVDPEQFRKHLGHHMQQIALFALPRLTQDQNRSLGSVDVEDGSDQGQDVVSTGFRWIRDDCGRGWSILSRRRMTFIAFACFLKLYVPKTATKYYQYFNTFISKELPLFGFEQRTKERLAYRAAEIGENVKLQYRLRDEEVPKFARLSLFDIFILYNNSDSMGLGNRLRAQNQTVKSIVRWANRIEKNGVSLRFVHGDQDESGHFDKLTDPNKIDDLLSEVVLGGINTPSNAKERVVLGRAIEDKVLEQLFGKLFSRRRTGETGEALKPQIVMIISDQETVYDINQCWGASELLKSEPDFTEYGPVSTCFILSWAGESETAREVSERPDDWQGGLVTRPDRNLEQAMEDFVEREGEIAYDRYLLKLFMSAVDSNLVNASEIVEERDGSSVGDTEE